MEWVLFINNWTIKWEHRTSKRWVTLHTSPVYGVDKIPRGYVVEYVESMHKKKTAYAPDTTPGVARGEGTEKKVLYGVEDTPPPHLCFAFALQVGRYIRMLKSRQLITGIYRVAD